MADHEVVSSQRRSRLRRRLLSGFGLALAIALSAFLLLSASKSGSIWFASIWFLALLPAVLCALICYIGDPDRTRTTAFYWLVPFVLGIIVCLASYFVLQEGCRPSGSSAAGRGPSSCALNAIVRARRCNPAF